MEIMKAREGKTVYFDATNTTNRILKVLEEERPEIVLLDELDKLPRNFAEKLLSFLESGRVKVDQKNCQMDFELKGCKVVATANEINRISKPLHSRFMTFYLSRYSEEEFLNIAEAVLSKLSPSIARYIGAKVYQNNGDIRAAINTGRLIKKEDGPREIEMIMNTLMKYSEAEKK